LAARLRDTSMGSALLDRPGANGDRDIAIMAGIICVVAVAPHRGKSVDRRRPRQASRHGACSAANMPKLFFSAVAGSARVSLLALLVALGGCGGKSRGSSEAEVTAQQGAKYCEAHSDCVVVETADICCGFCGTPAPQDVSAISRDERKRRLDRDCAADIACPSEGCIPVTPRYLGACEENACAVVDLWNHEATACTEAADCSLRSASCCGCGGSSESISSFVAVSRSDNDLPFCDSSPACDPCVLRKPGTFFAACVDEACRAVDCAEVGVESGGTCDAWSGSCFSPTQNLEQAYDMGAVGCPCSALDEDVCVSDSNNRDVALICDEGVWQAVQDGPCMIAQ
jgi:hypothetical protein